MTKNFLDICLEHNGISDQDVADHLSMPLTMPVLPDVHFREELRDYLREIKAKNENILIWGDYDCDGLTGSATLYKFFKHCGFNVFIHLPMRADGYSINLERARALVKKKNIHKVITVDCGVSSLNEIAGLLEDGVETIITDHHRVPDELPPARFILHPQVLGIPEAINFAGAGVAFWLTYLMKDLTPEAATFDYDKWVGLAAIGTIGDLTPLKGLNRQLVKYGLRMLREREIPGVSVLCDMNCINRDNLDETTLAFQVIPRLNAAGRVSSPLYSFILLATEDKVKLPQIVDTLNRMNEHRKDLCQMGIHLAESQLVDTDDPVIFISDKWEHGVVGIIAAQLADKYNKPVFLLAEEEGFARGSARCPEWFNVYEALKAVSSLTRSFGGHACAGGFSVNTENIPLMKEALCIYAKNAGMIQVHKKSYDFDIEELDDNLMANYRMLQPFGPGFEQPRLQSKSVKFNKVSSSRDKKHLFANKGDIRFVKWSGYDKALRATRLYDIIYTLGTSEYNAEKPYLQCYLDEIIPTDA